MQVYLGPFHPCLEEQLVREIRREKEADPLAPLLVLVPSAPIRNRIKVLLSEEGGVALLNFHLLTFHQLSRRLHEERFGGTDPASKDELFFEEVLRQTLRDLPPDASPFPGLEETPGGCAALWQTFRDLKDGLVDPEAILSALEEGLIGEEENRGGAAGALNLYREVRRRCEALGIRDYTDLDLLSAEGVPASGFLKGFRRIFYYGFYDLTQVQLDLFQAVVRACPVTLFFPLVEKDPAWEFAERFYRRYLRGLIVDPAAIRHCHCATHCIERRNGFPGEAISEVKESVFDEIASPPSAPRNDSPKISIIHCSGARDEVLTAAKEILRLREEEGFPFHAIGVAVREMGGYGPWISEIFPKHGIPVTGGGRESLIRHPLAQAVLLLATLPVRDYLRSEVIDLLVSPYFNARPLTPDGIQPRPDLWDFLTRTLGITRGIRSWSRLRRRFDVLIAAGEESSPGESRWDGEEISIPASESEILHGIVSRLHAALEALPPEGSWFEYAERMKSLLEEFLSLGEPDPDTPMPSREERVTAAILRILDDLPSLDRIVSPIPRDRFLQTFRTWLERGSVPLGEEETAGVSVMDAMAGRGLSFRALFLLGLNEGVFPRVIREDPFLKDDLRRGMDTVLGCKVPEKMAGYDEERLLFALLTGAARERLYLFHQRSDDAGRAAAPSGYLLEFRRNLPRVVDVEERGIPRGILDKEEVPPFRNPGFLTPYEAAIRSILRRRDPMPILERFSLHPALYRNGVRALESLDRFPNILTAHDGMTGPLPGIWEKIRRRGVPPTALEDYARCPFFFFARHLLELRPLERPEDLTEIDRRTLGDLGHEILRNFHQALLDRGYFSKGGGEPPPLHFLREMIRRVFSDYDAEHAVGYPILWEVWRETMEEMLVRVAAIDLDELSRTGYRPAAIEASCRARFPEDWPEPLGGLPLAGRLDRIDRDEAGRLRVIDYKFTWGKERRAGDKDLIRAALRGDRLQLPVYLLLAAGRSFDGTPDRGTEEAAFYFVAPRWAEGPLVPASLSGTVWEGATGESLRETLAILLQGIREGCFFILPGSHCAFCDLSTLCRRDHPPTRWRTDHDPAAVPLRLLGEKKGSS